MKQQAIIRLIVLVFAVINQILITMGWHPLPFNEDQVYEALSAGLVVGSALVAWWKNNNVTDEAQEAQRYLNKLKGDE